MRHYTVSLVQGVGSVRIQIDPNPLCLNSEVLTVDIEVLILSALKVVTSGLWVNIAAAHQTEDLNGIFRKLQ